MMMMIMESTVAGLDVWSGLMEEEEEEEDK